MPFGLSRPPRASRGSDRRVRRAAQAIAGSTGGNFRSILAELRGGEFVEILTTKDNKRLFEAHHTTLGSIEMTVGSLTGGQISTSNSSLTTFLADSNGTQWKYRTNGLGITFSITGVAQAIQCTAGGITINLDGYAAGQLQDGDWLLIYDEDGNAGANPITIAQDSGESHTINGSTDNLLINEDYSGYLMIFDGNLDWMAFKMTGTTAGQSGGYRDVFADTTITGNDFLLDVNCASANRTVTLPAAADVPNRIFVVRKTDSGAFTVTLDGDASETINGSTTYVLGPQYDTVAIMSLGGAWAVIYSNKENDIRTVTANTTLNLTHRTVLVDATSGNLTMTLPTAASADTKVIYNIKKIDSSSNTVTIDGNGSETIDGATTQVIGAQYDSVTVQSDGTTWWIL